MKIEKGVRRKTITNWKVKIEKWKGCSPEGQRTIEVPTLSENSQRCQEIVNLSSTTIDNLIKKSDEGATRYGATVGVGGGWLGTVAL